MSAPSTGSGFSAADDLHMRRALELAEAAFGLTEPNPRVGCVLVGPGWRAEGHTQRAGDAHAEVMALRAAHAAGHATAGCTAYVTLEPCAHHGRTPPCCDALVAAGVARVVVALEDPFPKVAGEGLRRLRASGVEVATGLCEDEAREVNIGFFSRMTRGRPFVRLKAAVSLDGRSGLADGRSQWITGAAARADGHRWRRRAGAVLTGVGTVLADDPRLDVREVETAQQPLRIVLDGRLRTPATARILAPSGEVLIVCGAEAPEAAAQALHAAGATVLRMPADASRDGRIDLAALLAELARRGINELHVEAGPALNASWLAQGLVDELLVYMAPTLIGPGQALASLPALDGLSMAARFNFVEARPIDADLRLRLRPAAG